MTDLIAPDGHPVCTDRKTWDELMAMTRDEFRAYFGFGPDTPPITFERKYLPSVAEIKPATPPKKPRARRTVTKG